MDTVGAALQERTSEGGEGAAWLQTSFVLFWSGALGLFLLAGTDRLVARQTKAGTYTADDVRSQTRRLALDPNGPDRLTVPSNLRSSTPVLDPVFALPTSTPSPAEPTFPRR